MGHVHVTVLRRASVAASSALGRHASDVNVAAGTRENGAHACGGYAKCIRRGIKRSTCDRVSADGLWHVLMHAPRRDLGVYVSTPGINGIHHH